MDVTKTMREIDDMRMSNMDYSIDPGLAEALMKEPGLVFAQHAAWDHWGAVYYTDGVFHEQVWVYHSIRKTLSAPSLRELMNDVNDQYGWE